MWEDVPRSMLTLTEFLYKSLEQLRILVSEGGSGGAGSSLGIVD